MKNFGIAALFLLGFVILETAVFSNIIILPAVPDFILICSLYFSLHNGRLYGTCAGFAGGFFLDCLSASPFGLHCLLRTILGYIWGFFFQSLNVSGILFPVLYGVTGTLLKVLVLWIIAVFFTNVNETYEIFSAAFAFQLIINGLLTPVVFKFLDIFKNTLVLNPEKVR